MDWMDVAAVVFFCTTANHLGLVGSVIAVFSKNRRKLPIVSCPRCFSFWSVLVYGLSGDGIAANPSCLARLLAISILSSYIAIWLELLEGIIDKLYSYIYGKIYPTADSSDDDAAGA